MAQSRPVVWPVWWGGDPTLMWHRTECPGHFARAFGQPDQDTLANPVTGRGAGAEVWQSCGLDTGPEGTRASGRFQAIRPQILWFRGVTNRHIVATPAYSTTGGMATCLVLNRS